MHKLPNYYHLLVSFRTSGQRGNPLHMPFVRRERVATCERQGRTTLEKRNPISMCRYLRGKRFKCASLVNHTLIVQPTNRGANVAMLDGPLAASVPGKVIAAALSPARQHLAVVFQQGHECILEVHSDSGRPWRLRSDAPLGLCAIAFFDENRLAGLNCRQEGHSNC